MDYMRQNGNADITADIADAPEMKLRACIGLQKTEYLPYSVYEYPYTLQNFPWFYDRGLWTKYLDMLAADNMNAVYLWNAIPSASLVKLKIILSHKRWTTPRCERTRKCMVLSPPRRQNGASA